jgi:hypothetical protein
MDTEDGAGFGGTDEAVEGLMSAARYLAGADYPSLPPAVRAGAVLGMSQAGSVLTIAQGLAVRAFDASDDHELDGQQNTTSWMRHIARSEDGKAWLAWARNISRHPVLTQAVTDGILHASWAAKLFPVTGKIPPEHREVAEQILADLAAAGANLGDLRHAASVALARTATADPDEGDDSFGDRFLDVQTTMDGAGTINGNLTPQMAAALLAVIGALDGRCGPEDDRSVGARRHDGLYVALVRLLSSDLLPAKDGKAVTAIVHMTLADLIAKADADGSPITAEWITGQAARWAAHLAGPYGGDGGTWVTGKTAHGTACDAVLFPLVMADPDLTKLSDLVTSCVQLNSYLHREPPQFTPDRDAHRQAIAELTAKIIGTAAEFLSGPGGLAGYLRTNLMGDIGLAGPSLPLDAGDTDTIPWHIRKAVRARDVKCAWPGGCDQPAMDAQPHHLVHRTDGGHSSTTNLYCLCFFHHHVLLHRRGWTLRALGDGTLQATSPDGTTVYRSRSRPPPPRPG